MSKHTSMFTADAAGNYKCAMYLSVGLSESHMSKHISICLRLMQQPTKCVLCTSLSGCRSPTEAVLEVQLAAWGGRQASAAP